MKNLMSDIWTMTKRNLVHYKRLPQLIIFSFIQPIMFVLLWAYVFGGAIETDAGSYINWLLPGILVQTVLFGAMMTGVGLAEDMQKGMIERFRSLPMARSAVLMGRIITETLRNIWVIAIMIIVGYIIGFRISHGWTDFIWAMMLTLGFGFAFSWVSAAIGLAVKNVETAQSAGFIWVFPLAFISSIFVPIESMKSGVRAFAEHNPITYTVDVVRALLLGNNVGNELWYSLAWIIGITIVFTYISIRQYRKSS